MFGAKKVSPACPLLCMALASVDMAAAIRCTRDLLCVNTSCAVECFKQEANKQTNKQTNKHVECCSKPYHLGKGSGIRSLQEEGVGKCVLAEQASTLTAPPKLTPGE